MKNNFKKLIENEILGEAGKLKIPKTSKIKKIISVTEKLITLVEKEEIAHPSSYLKADGGYSVVSRLKSISELFRNHRDDFFEIDWDSHMKKK